MKKDTCTFVVECDTFQTHKGETMKPPSELQPLPIPNAVWTDISMNFIIGLPKSNNWFVIMVVDDYLPNMLIFVPYNTFSRPLW